MKNRRLLSNTFFSFVVKGGALFVSLFTLPAYMRYFNNQEVLGVWFTAISVVSWILTFDLGIGNGLRNHLVHCFAKKEIFQAKRYISSAYFMTGIFVILVSFFGYWVSSFVNWNRVFNVRENLVSSILLLKAVRLIFLGILLQFFFRLISSILFAMQKSAVPGFLALLSNILLLIFVLNGNSNNVEGNLLKLSYFSVVASNLPLLIATVVLFSTKLRNCIPSFRLFNKSISIKIMLLGGSFFWLQIMFMLISNTNEFLISWFIGSGKVVDYKIYNSLFNMIGSVFVVSLTPIWSEVTEAFSKKEFAWISNLYKRLQKFALMAIAGELILAFSLQTLIDIWLKDKAIKVQLKYSFVFFFSGTIFIWNAILSSIVNGLGKLKTSIIFLTLGAIINIPLAYLLAKLTGSWISVIIANIISMLPFCIAQSLSLRRFFFNVLSDNMLRGNELINSRKAARKI